MRKTTLLASALVFCFAVRGQVNLNNNLILCMPFSGNATDMSGNGNNGTINGATLTTDRNGNPNKAYAFNGSSDYILVPGSASLNKIDSTSELTVSAWCKINNWYQNWNVFAIVNRYSTASGDGWDYTIQAPVGCSEQLFAPNQPLYYSGCEFSAAGTTTFNTWVHYAITYSKANSLFSAYKNGQLVSSITITVSGGLPLENTNNGDLYIGFSPSGPDEYSDGAMDELMLYNRALNAAEILALYNGNTCSRTGTVTGIAEGLPDASLAAVFPNPGSDQLSFSITEKSSAAGNIRVSLYACDGKKVLSEKLPEHESGSYSVNINDLPQGLYFLTLQSGSATQTIKFIKN